MTTGASVKRQVGSDPAERGLRHGQDFYRTGSIATRALLMVERFPGIVWEPACGAGDMSVVLADGIGTTAVLSSDLYDRGYGITGVDFLGPQPEWARSASHVVTNPPFTHVEEFVARGLELGVRKLALIARLQWLEGQRRKKRIFDVTPPARIWVFPYRIPMTRGDLDTPRVGLVAFAWYVWDRDHVGAPVLGWLPTPRP